MTQNTAQIYHAESTIKKLKHRLSACFYFQDNAEADYLLRQLNQLVKSR